MTRFPLLLCALITFQAAAQQTFLIKTKNASISYSTYGTGNPLLLINGGPGYHSDHLIPVAKELAKNFKVILFDQRGTGKSVVSTYDSSTINLQATLDDIEAIRKDLKLSKWNVSGQSFGGLLAMSYAVAYPDKVQKLLLISSAGLDLTFINSFNDNVRNIIGKDTLLYRNPSITTNEEFFLNLVSVNAPAYVFDKSKADLVRKTLNDKEGFVFEVNALIWQDLFKMDFNLAPKFKSFNKPTLIIQGAQDIVGMDTAYKIKDAIKGSSLQFIRRCGHIPWLDQPAVFYSSVVNFLK